MKRKIKLLAFLCCILCIFSACGKETEYPFVSTEDEVFLIETPYCDLYYPKAWSNQIEINTSEKDSYKVEFLTTIKEEKIKLFDLYFGGNRGDEIGILSVNGKKISIKVESYSIDLEKYSEDEQIDLTGMKEDLNIIISKLIENYDFELV